MSTCACCHDSVQFSSYVQHFPHSFVCIAVCHTGQRSLGHCEYLLPAITVMGEHRGKFSACVQPLHLRCIELYATQHSLAQDTVGFLTHVKNMSQSNDQC